MSLVSNISACSDSGGTHLYVIMRVYGIGGIVMNRRGNVKANSQLIMSVEAEGDIDAFTAPAFKDLLMGSLKNGHRKVLLNLDKLTFIDSSGLGVLIGIQERLRERNGAFAIVSSNPSLKNVFEVAGLVWLFQVHANERDALHSLAMGC